MRSNLRWLRTLAAAGIALCLMPAARAEGPAARKAEAKAPKVAARWEPAEPSKLPPENAEAPATSKPAAAESTATEHMNGREAERYYRQERRRSWIFRRYAGTIDMQQKVPYPELYYGPYYQRPWKPDWVHPLPPPPMRYDEGPLGRRIEDWPVEMQPTPVVPQDPAPAPGVPPGTAARKTRPRS